MVVDGMIDSGRPKGFISVDESPPLCTVVVEGIADRAAATAGAA
jgi:hypothetical protein